MYRTYTKHNIGTCEVGRYTYLRLILYTFIYYSTYFKLDKYTKNPNLNDSKNKSKKSKKILNNLYVLDNIYFL